MTFSFASFQLTHSFKEQITLINQGIITPPWNLPAKTEENHTKPYRSQSPGQDWNQKKQSTTYLTAVFTNGTC